MTKKNSPPRNSIDAPLRQNIFQNATVSDNLAIHVIRVTEDKIELAVYKYLNRIKKRNSWQTPAGIFLTILMAFITTDFKDMILSKDSWQAVFLICGTGSLIWTIKCLNELRGATVKDFLAVLREGDQSHNDVADVEENE